MAQSPRNRRGTAQRAAVLAAASECFANRPYDEVSVDDIAVAAGVPKSSVFYYFGSKRDCYLEVLGEFSRALLAVDETELSQHDLAAQMLKVYLDFAVASEPAYRTLMSGGLGNDPIVNQFVAGERAKFRAVFATALGVPQPEPPALRTAFEGLLSFIEGVTLDWLTHRDIDRATVVRLILTAAFAMPEAVLAADPDALRKEQP